MSEAFLDIIFNAIGVLGVVLILIAYFLLQTNRLKASDIAYPVLNLIGATLHIISLIQFWNLASFIIEIFWIGISLYGIWKIKGTDYERK